MDLIFAGEIFRKPAIANQRFARLRPRLSDVVRPGRKPTVCSAEAAFFKCGPPRKMDGEKIYYLTLPTIVYYAGSGKET